MAIFNSYVSLPEGSWLSESLAQQKVLGDAEVATTQYIAVPCSKRSNVIWCFGFNPFEKYESQLG